MALFKSKKNESVRGMDPLGDLIGDGIGFLVMVGIGIGAAGVAVIGLIGFVIVKAFGA